VSGQAEFITNFTESSTATVLQSTGLGQRIAIWNPVFPPVGIWMVTLVAYPPYPANPWFPQYNDPNLVVFNVEDAWIHKTGEWIEVGTVQSASDIYQTQVTYSQTLNAQTSQSFSTKTSFSQSLEAGASFIVEAKETTTLGLDVCKTLSTSTSTTIQQSLGTMITRHCPAGLCDGTKIVKVWQYKVAATLAGSLDFNAQLSDSLLFSMYRPKCGAPCLCDPTDLQCQKCLDTC